MEIQGKIVRDLGEQSGTSARGNAWKKHEYILETHDSFPKTVCLTVFGDRVEQYPMAVGDEVTASIDLNSREYNGRWYTNVDVWKVEKGAAAPAAAAPGAPAPGAYAAPAPAPAAPAPAAPAPAADPFGAPAAGNDDLPF